MVDEVYDLPYTGDQTAEYLAKARDFSGEVLGNGLYQDGKVYTNYQQYLNDNGALFKLNPSVEVPYNVDLTTYGLAKDDPNLISYTSFESASTEAIAEFEEEGQSSIDSFESSSSEVIDNLNNVTLGAESFNSYVEFVEDFSESESNSVTTPDGKVVRSVSGANEAIDEAINRVPANTVNSTSYLMTSFDGSNLSAGDTVSTLGFYSMGGQGGAKWKKTGNTIGPSQSPSDTGVGTLSDSVGNEFEYCVRADGWIQMADLGAIADGSESGDVFVAAWYTARNYSRLNPLPVKCYGIEYGHGTYTHSSVVYDVNDTTNRNVYMNIKGQGLERTFINLSVQDSWITWTKTNYGQYMAMQDMTLLANYGSSIGATVQTPQACPIVLNQFPTGDRRDRHHTFKFVNFGSSNRSVDYFNGYLDITGGGRGFFYELKGWGIFEAGLDRVDTWVADFGFKTTDHYAPEYQKVGSWGTKLGFSFTSEEDPGPEGGSFLEVIGDALVGIHVESPSSLGEPGLAIEKAHFNYGDVGIKIVNRRYVRVKGVLFFSEFDDRDAADFLLENVSYSHFRDNIHGFAGNVSRTAYRVSGGQRGSVENSFYNNLILDIGTGFDFQDSDVINNNVYSNTFTVGSSTDRYINAGSDNRFTEVRKRISRRSLSADVTIASATLSTVVLDTADKSSDAIVWVPATSSFVVADNYGVTEARVRANITFKNNSTGSRYIRLLKNGANFSGAGGSYTAAYQTNEINFDSGTIDVEDGDSFTLVAYQSSGGDLDLTALGRSWLEIEAI